MNRIACGIDQPRGDENEQIGLISLGGLGLEQSSDQRNVAEKRNFIINLLQLLRDKTAQDDRLTVPNYDAGDQIENSGCLMSLGVVMVPKLMALP